jgi:SRSO17 transposase
LAPGRGRDLDALLASVLPRFGRAEPWRHAGVYVRGLLSDLVRKNGWTLAEFAGARDATSMQRMLNAARWDTDGVRDDVRRWLVHRFGDWNRGMLVVDEVCFPKAGSHSVGVHRHHPPGSQRAANAQVAVLLSYVSPRGRALVDCELFLPPEWLADRARARALGVPDEVSFADGDGLAVRMVQRAFEAHGPTAWVVAGGSLAPHNRLRAWLGERGQPYVLATPVESLVPVRDGALVEPGRIVDAVPRSAWIRADRTSAPAAAGERWALVSMADPADPSGAAGAAGAERGQRLEHGLLIRRPSTRSAESEFYRCGFPGRAPLLELVRAARAEDTVRQNVRWANENIGLDHYQVRRYDAWYRHMTLCLLAGVFVATSRLEGRRPAGDD